MSQTQRVRMLELLRRPEGATNRDFIDAGIFRYSSRIDELRQRGHVIPPPTKVRGSLFRYRLEGLSQPYAKTPDEIKNFWKEPAFVPEMVGKPVNPKFLNEAGGVDMTKVRQSIANIFKKKESK